MRTSIAFFSRLLFAWGILFFSLLALSSIFFHQGPPGFMAFVGLGMLVFVILMASSHLRRVRLIADHVDSSTLANRQRRQIEIPLEANEAFAVVDAAIRELPHTEDIQSAKDSLQVRAKVKRIDPYGAGLPIFAKIYTRLGTQRNQILATVAPGESTGSVRLLCEPEGRAWCDWFIVDDGTNLENANALTRAISRRIAEKRRSETVAVKETVTEKELVVAKLGLLQAQVEPHFLYNTLGSAKYLIKSDPARAEEMIDNLILYLRHSLPRADDPLSTLGEELDRTKAYLDILQIRMGARLQTQITIPDALRRTRFPSMMLQTLAENAIKHGLEPKTGGGNIWILARQLDQTISVTVADDGRGFHTDTAGTGIGLNNIRERLQLTYGAAASLTLVANFPTGVAATITLPFESASA